MTDKPWEGANFLREKENIIKKFNNNNYSTTSGYWKSEGMFIALRRIEKAIKDDYEDGKWIPYNCEHEYPSGTHKSQLYCLNCGRKGNE